jgi:hypothetical protein
MAFGGPPNRSEFVRSRLYLCAVAFNKRNDERMKNIRDLLEKVDQNKKRTKQSSSNKKYISSWAIPECDDKVSKKTTTEEDKAILSSSKDDVDWVYDESNNDYVLKFGDITVMKVPKKVYTRLKPFQR